MRLENEKLTKTEFIQQLCTKPSLFNKRLTELDITSLTGIVTYIKIDTNNYHVLSRFEDDEWIFPATKATAGTPCNKNRFNFKTIKNTTFRLMTKWILWQDYSNGLAVGSLSTNTANLKAFFQWVMLSKINEKQGLTAFIAREYVAHVNTLTHKFKSEDRLLSIKTKAHRLLAIERLYHHCRMFCWIKEHPWINSSALEQAGFIGQVKKNAETNSKTSIIPAEVLTPLCVFTHHFLDKAAMLLDLRDKLTAFEPKNINSKKRRYLQSIQSEFDTLHQYNEAIVLLRDSCIFWILLTTGMRIHEVLGIKRNGYKTEEKDGETYYYVKSVSTKTYEGNAEWIAPKVAIDAIKILERYSQPFQATLDRDLKAALNENNHEERLRLQQCSNKVCLASTQKQSNKISILSKSSITDTRLPNLCKQINNDWNLSAHQFRRTFANYAVHSELGDLRALKDHFKHWSITMTALYASNDDLDQELFEELLREKYWVEEEIKYSWFELDMPITGGDIAEKIIQVRSNEQNIKTFGSHREMAKAFSSNIPIRATGIGWCTNDDDGCMGGKCDECEHGIIDKRNIKHWEGMLIQQLKLAEIDDVGEPGKQAIAKGMERCEKVLTSLGINIDTLKAKIHTQNNMA